MATGPAVVASVGQECPQRLSARLHGGSFGGSAGWALPGHPREGDSRT